MIPKPVRQIGYSVIIYYIYYYTSKALGMLGVDALLGWVNEWIAMQFSNLEPSTVDVMQSIVPYVFPVLVVGILFAAFYYFDKVFEKAPPQITETPAQGTIVAPDTDLIHLQEVVLTQFHKIADLGNALLVKRIKEDEFEAWKQNVKKFRFAAIGTIRKHISRTEAIKFNRSLTFGKLNFNHKINEEHNRMLAMLRVQVDKLIAVIEKYEENISATK